jgi:transposase InsO family protein
LGGAPAGKRLALVVLVPILRRDGELDLTDAEAALLCRMSAATIDRRLAPERARMTLRGRSHTKPGSLLKSQIPIRTWADWNDAAPGFVEIDLVGHEGGNSSGEFCFTLTVTDIATGWTINRSVRNKAQRWVFEALQYASTRFPFPIRGIDSDNGSEFINDQLLRYCTEHQITFTRSRPGNKNDGAHVEQKNWARVRELVGYYRYDTPAELAKLNEIWELDALFTNYYLPQQKLIFKQRRGAKVIKRYDTATTPHQRAVAHPDVRKRPIITMNAQFKQIKPAALSRQILALTGQLEILAQAKAAPRAKPPVNHTWNDGDWRTALGAGLTFDRGARSSSDRSQPGIGGEVTGGGKCRAVTDDGEDLDGGPEPDAGHRGQDLGKRVGLQASFQVGGQRGSLGTHVTQLRGDASDHASELCGAGHEDDLRV